MTQEDTAYFWRKENGYFKSVVEKSANPPSNLANAGIYLLERSIFDIHAISAAIRAGRVRADRRAQPARRQRKDQDRGNSKAGWRSAGPGIFWPPTKSCSRISSPASLGEVEPGANLLGNVSVGRGSIVRSGAYIVGPVLIGEDCDIGPNCYIRPATCLGDNVRIGNAVEVKNSAIMSGSKIGHLSYVGDSVIGERCNFGAGTVCSNLRHDKGNIKSFIKGERVDSGRRKLGVIMGDDVMTGINTSIYPGTVIESGFRGLPAAIHKGLVFSKEKAEYNKPFQGKG